MSRALAPGRNRTDRRRATRTVSGVLAAWGVVQLARPGQLVRTLSPDRPGPRLWVVRLLGARMLAQHALVITAPDRPVVALSATVDGIHAATMLLTAATMPAYRRASLVSAGVAGAASLAGMLAAPRAQR
ncbi:MAG: hypothetical protein JWP46_2656 [Modestobacter sp.]|nr:hypothetical protein [Modestobacter sp.]